MTIQTLEWYRVKETGQFCQVTGIASTTNPDIQVKTATLALQGFHTYLLWFTPDRNAPHGWMARAIMMELRKAFALLREPGEDDLPLLRKLQSVSKDIPVASMSVDGTRTEPFAKGGE